MPFEADGVEAGGDGVVGLTAETRRGTAERLWSADEPFDFAQDKRRWTLIGRHPRRMGQGHTPALRTDRRDSEAMTLDKPWKIAAIIAVLVALRIVWGLWRGAPARKGTTELLDSGIIAFVLVFLIIRPFVVQAFFIPSESMVPTLLKGDRILVNRFVYRLNEPERGDIVVFDAPPEAVGGPEHKDFVKRLIGLPGDRIEVRHGDGVYMNGRKLVEPEGVAIPEYDWPAFAGDPYSVPAGCYFVLGDNRNRSRDSHLWSDANGQARPELEARRLRGKAMVIFWPPRRVRLLGDHRQIR